MTTYSTTGATYDVNKPPPSGESTPVGSRTTSDRPERGLVPRLPRQLLVRPRLYKLLSDRAPITVLRGPQGYGKTALVAGWLADHQPLTMTTVWISAGPGLGKPEAFSRHLNSLAHAAGLSTPRPAAAAPVAGKRTTMAGERSELDQALRDLPCNHTVIAVLDSARHIRDETTLRTLVELVQQHRQLHLIVCSRGRHPIESLAAGTVDMRIIPASELLLSIEEIGELAHVMGNPLRAGDAEKLYQAVGGWMSATRLVLEAAGSGELPLAAAEEYLRGTVLPGITDQGWLTHLMRFSLAERLDTRLARQLCDDAQPDRLLAALEETGLLERHYHGSSVQLRFPALMRDILREAYTAREPAAARAFHRRLADWFASHEGPDHLAHAYQHAAAAEDWQRVQEIGSQHGAALCMGYPHLVHRTLRAMPDSVLTVNPRLQVAREVIGAVVSDADTDADGRMVPLRVYYEASQRIIKQHQDTLPLNDLAHIGTGHLIGLRMQGRFDEAAAFATQLALAMDRLIATGPDKPGDCNALLHLQRGLTQTLIGGDDDAIASYQLAWEHGIRTHADFIPSNAAANLALTYAMRGNSRQAQFWLQRHHTFDTHAQWGHHLIGIGAHLATGLLALDRLDPLGCRAELDHLGDGSQPVELWPFVAYLHAQHGLHYGDPATTLAGLDAAQRAHHRDLGSQGAALALLARARADLLIACGQGQRARQLLQKTDMTGNAALAVAMARIHLLAGDHAGARRIAANSLWHPSTSTRERLELSLIKAAAALRMNDHAQARRQAGQTFTLYQYTRALRVFTAISRADLEQLLDLAGCDLAPGELTRIDAATLVYPDLTLVTLTGREQYLLVALEETASRQDIAKALFVSLNTVKTQLAALYRKLGTSTREETLMRVRQLGLLG